MELQTLQAEPRTRTPSHTHTKSREASWSRSMSQMQTALSRLRPARSPSHLGRLRLHSPSVPARPWEAQLHSQQPPQAAPHHTHSAGTLETARSSRTELK